MLLFIRPQVRTSSFSLKIYCEESWQCLSSHTVGTMDLARRNPSKKLFSLLMSRSAREVLIDSAPRFTLIIHVWCSRLGLWEVGWQQLSTENSWKWDTGCLVVSHSRWNVSYFVVCWRNVAAATRFAYFTICAIKSESPVWGSNEFATNFGLWSSCASLSW